MKGLKIGRLFVLEREGTNSDNRATWICLCDCGEKTVVTGKHLRNGDTKICGCLDIDKKKERMTKHGRAKTRLYNIYSDIKKRCYNSNFKFYQYYGGRGIKVCNEWFGENGFINFYNWAMNNGYSDDLSIDRIDVNGNYEPSNCRWATMKEQNNNKINSHFVTINGITKTIGEWADISGLSFSVIRSRVIKGLENDDILKPVERVVSSLR